ncbi:hypothetical protein MOSE0_N12750 [Monosporozyma servazzii]
MLFTAITRRNVYKDPFTCWICLDEETDPLRQKKQWYRHSCSCNLQLHKKCYLNLVYQSIRHILTPAPEGLEKSSITLEFLKGSLCSFVYHNGFKPLQTFWWSFKRFTSALFAHIVEATIMSFLVDDKDRARLRTTISGWETQTSITRLTEDTLPEFFKKNPGNMPKCPQCKKEILNSNDMDFIHQPFLFWAYDKFLECIDYFPFIGLAILLLGNPFINSLKLGLWQFRCIFPESQLRYILNLETTKSLDVYLKSFKGATTISGKNKFLIGGLPLYLFATTSGQRPEAFILFVGQIYWYRCFKKRIMNYKKQGINLNLLYKCFSKSILFLSVYTFYIGPLVSELVTSDRIRNSIMSQEKDEKKGMIKMNKYFAKIRESELSLFAQSTMWPLVGNLVGKLLYSTYISLKRYYNLHDTDIIPGFYASSDEYQMIFNLIGMGVVGLSSSLFSKLAWANRYERKLQTEAMVEEIINE